MTKNKNIQFQDNLPPKHTVFLW